MAQAASTIPPSLHPDLKFLDEHGERFFRDITVYLRDGSFSSTRELASSVTTFLALHNAQPCRSVWSAKGEDILRKIQRARETMDSTMKKNVLSETAH